MNLKYVAYVDGACSHNQTKSLRSGGYGIIIYRQEDNGAITKLKRSGRFPGVTNNQAEVKACIEALKIIIDDAYALGRPYPVVSIHSDSGYTVKPISEGWIHVWKQSGWRRVGKKRKVVLNSSLWKILYELLSSVDSLKLLWVDGKQAKKNPRNFHEKMNKVVNDMAQKEAKYGTVL